MKIKIIKNYELSWEGYLAEQPFFSKEAMVLIKKKETPPISERGNGGENLPERQA